MPPSERRERSFWARWSRRLQVIPTWAKLVPIGAMLLVMAWVHHSRIVDDAYLRESLRHLYFLPLFMASLLFGLKGGIICAVLIAINYFPSLSGVGESGDYLSLRVGLEVGVFFLVGGVTGLIVDRERRESRRLRESEDLALLGQAAAAVAHELKNPLIAIGGFAQRMLREVDDEDPHHERLRIIVDQASHMENLLREMLEYSRPLKLRRQPEPLNQLVDEVVEMASLMAQEGDVKLLTALGGGLGAPALDAPRIKQVLLNLIQNAVQASGPGDEVRVATSRRDTQAVVEVSDQGQGISEEHRSQIFSPFFTTKHQGTGLGLAISQKIAKAHGGELVLQETRGSGTTFELRLPLEDSSAP